MRACLDIGGNVAEGRRAAHPLPLPSPQKSPRVSKPSEPGERLATGEGIR